MKRTLYKREREDGDPAREGGRLKKAAGGTERRRKEGRGKYPRLSERYAPKGERTGRGERRDREDKRGKRGSGGLLY